MRRPTLVEVGQALCVLCVLAGLFMLVSLAWFLVVAGILGLALCVAMERQSVTDEQASAPPTESDGA
jgi:hypothetical protein